MTAKFRFNKMHGLGNDFIVIDGINQNIDLNPRLIKQLSNRHTGVGFDQCLIVEAPKNNNSDFYYRIFNADGNEVGQCGNGARCLAIFIRDNNLSNKSEYLVETKTSSLLLKPMSDDLVWLEMDEPNFKPQNIPLAHEFQADFYPFEINGTTHYLHCINVGNPHGILIVDDFNDEQVNSLGLALSQHPKFIEGANISFVKILSKQHIQLRVFERGAGETLACGSGALAASAAVRLFHHCAEKITVSLPGGDLNIRWKGLGHKISFTGPAINVFDGHWHI